MRETSGLWARLLGRTPKQQALLRQRVAHPVRTGFLFGALYAIVLGAVFFRKDGVAAFVVAGIAGVFYGWSMVLWQRRRVRQLDRTSSEG